PVTIGPAATLADALGLMHSSSISGIHVVEQARRLLGILTNRDLRFASDPEQNINELITKDSLVTVKQKVDQQETKRMLHSQRI
ncbi:CBS domain-containing protein, partial [Rhizobium ruizarguesonis]